MKRAGRTSPFRTVSGGIVPGSVAEVGYCRLGGVDQWVKMLGRSLANPPLIHLHGGPGFSETRLWRHFNAELEDRFTVVYWDQRGAGKSFDGTLPRSSMTTEQFLADLGELVHMVCARVGQQRVVLHGHSWGSALGVLYASRHPERVAAYVGTGQIGDWPAGESASYAYAVAEASRRKNSKALAALRAIGPPPYSASSVFKERTWLQRLDGQLSPRALWRLRRAVLGGESSLLDLPNQLRGFRFSMNTMWDEVSALNLVTAAPALQVPVFFLLGRRDHFVPPETSVDYFNALTAPSKELVWFEQSGHEPFVDEPAKFNHAVINLVSSAPR
jgi:pimeloyl-ACP methyl ester carboxylesterase